MVGAVAIVHWSTCLLLANPYVAPSFVMHPFVLSPPTKLNIEEAFVQTLTLIFLTSGWAVKSFLNDRASVKRQKKLVL